MSWWRWLAGATVAVVVGAASWTAPSPPPTLTEVAAWSPGPPAAPARPHVAAPWREGRPELGIHLYWESHPDETPELVRRYARRIVDQVVGMEANAIAVSFPFFTDSITSSTLRPDPRTPPPEHVAVLIDEAARSGLRTTLRPLLDQTNLWDPVTEQWRGTFAPLDPAAWFSAYRDFLLPYLAVARDHAATTFVVGAELSALQAEPGWAGLIADARTTFPGRLAYSANWDAYPQAVAGVPADEITIDAYPILGLEPGATEDQIAAAWGAWLDGIAGPALRRTVLSEVGGAAETANVTQPARPFVADTPLDEEAQRRWFAAACRAARDRQLAGFYWWKLDFHVDPALADPDQDRHDSYLGRAAEAAARGCFVEWGARS